MSSLRFSRRRFLIAALLAAPILAVADARCLEPKWVKTRRLRLGKASRPTGSSTSPTSITRATAPIWRQW